MGPLSGVRVVEFDGVGPSPFACMLLSDMGAEVVRIERTGLNKLTRDIRDTPFDVVRRNRKSIALDIKSDQGRKLCLELVASAAILVEGFRPGVMERLGLGPEHCHEINPGLVYGRMTGWGQTGPLAPFAGHDINYIALTGALDSIGDSDRGPTVPLNIIGDYGGALYLNLGILAAYAESQKSGLGQVVDAAMTDASASLMAMYYGMHKAGFWSLDRGQNMLDGGAHFYNTYETADGKWIALGPVEPQFYALFLETLGVTDEELNEQMSPERWPALKNKLAGIFKTRTREDWIALFGDSDCCVSPVLSLDEVDQHPHNRARETFVEVEGIVQPNVAPRFSRTPGALQSPPPVRGAHSRELLFELGYTEREVQDLLDSGAVMASSTEHY